MNKESLYENIIEWLKDKPLFVQDSARRLLQNAELTDFDKKEIFELLKKECGFEGIKLESQQVTNSDIPTKIPSGNEYPKLISIKNPVNINSLDTSAKLNFDPNGITVVYGKNGSGKSSYSRILKRFCWSRHKDTTILPNVYKSDTTEQSVVIETGSTESPKQHQLKITNQEPIPELNSIYIFDSNCSTVYVNNETETEYKPAEIDLIQDLVDFLKELDDLVVQELGLLKAIKPELSWQDFGTTEAYQWFANIEKDMKEAVNNKLVISDELRKRHTELVSLLANSNLSKENNELTQKQSRYLSLKNEFLRIEKAFSADNFINIKTIKEDYSAKRGAYEASKAMVDDHNKLKGVGSESWKLLWSAARSYATTEIHPESLDYPSNKSSDVCVLCQQELDEDAKKRLVDFDSFIKNNASAEFENSQKVLDSKLKQITDAQLLVSIDTLNEIKEDIKEFDSEYNILVQNFEQLKANWSNFLKNETVEEILISEYQETIEEPNQGTIQDQDSPVTEAILKVSYTKKLKSLSEIVNKEIEAIKKRIEVNQGLIKDRTILEKEKKELDALLYLESKKTEISTYLEESNLKIKLEACKRKLNTSQYSKKIGDLLETNAIDSLRTEFTSILNDFNSDLASKISLGKSRTASGTTFHKLGFATVTGSINSVLSEGEQKIISLAGFLAESTIGGSKNTIVFDDPVNSLDQDYRESIANKLIELCKDRQIIVFTHDLYFLSLLMYGSNEALGEECQSVSLEFTDSSGVVTDEVPFLAKNVQQRVDNIRTELDKLGSLTTGKDNALDSIRKKMRFLVEKSIEEILANKTIQRFSKNITVKKELLASYVVADKEDVSYLLDLYGKYSVTEHDGGFEIIPQLPDETAIRTDLKEFSDWKDKFKTKLDNYRKNGI